MAACPATGQRDRRPRPRRPGGVLGTRGHHGRGARPVIVTVTLNASLRVQYEAERVEWGAPNRVTRVRYRAGGQGLAVARVLRALGQDVVAAGFAGGSTGDL